jgi:hypothetical protein
MALFSWLILPPSEFSEIVAQARFSPPEKAIATAVLAVVWDWPEKPADSGRSNAWISMSGLIGKEAVASLLTRPPQL